MKSKINTICKCKNFRIHCVFVFNCIGVHFLVPNVYKLGLNVLKTQFFIIVIIVIIIIIIKNTNN